MNADWKKDLEQDLAELKIKANAGDVDAQYHCCVLLSTKAMSQYNPELFDESEKYLKLAAKQGYDKAKDRLKNQAIFRKGFENRVKRYKNENI